MALSNPGGVGEEGVLVISGGRNEYMANLNTVELIGSRSSCLLTPSVVPKMPIMIYDHMILFVQNRILYCGGHNRPNLLSRKCHYLEAGERAWREAADLPAPLMTAAKVSAGNKIYLLGGWTEGPVNTTFVYDPSSNSWSAGVTLTSQRISACAASYNGAIYITGGKRTKVGAASNQLDTVERLNPATETAWTALPSLVNKRSQHGCFVFKIKGKNVLVVAGGVGDSPAVSSSVEMLDLDDPAGKWEITGSLPVPRCCWPQMGMVGSQLAVISGELIPSDSFDLLDSQGEKWEAAGYRLHEKRGQASATALPPAFVTCPSQG